MVNTETRNGIPWDASYTYSWLDSMDLLAHYFPPSNTEEGIIELIHPAYLDSDNGKAILTQLHKVKHSQTKLALIDLSINSPDGNRESDGSLYTHAVALIIDKNGRTIIYQDPYGYGIDQKEWERYSESERATMPSLKTILTEIFPDFNIVEPKIRQQMDKKSCAPITINNLVTYAREHKIPETVDITAIRESHKDILLNADKKREQISSQKRTAGIELVASDIVSKISESNTVEDSQKNILVTLITNFLHQYYTESRNAALEMLADIQNPTQLSEKGNRLANNLLKALKDNLVITPTASSFTERFSDKPSIEVNAERLNTEGVQARLKSVTQGSLVLQLGFGRSNKSLALL